MDPSLIVTVVLPALRRLAVTGISVAQTPVWPHRLKKMALLVRNRAEGCSEFDSGPPPNFPGRGVVTFCNPCPVLLAIKNL
ncbi:hypothetical protein HD554DRAFT_867616 [Boletus coccyginus]|nr:hypothetical protein HD554DRAFT_867616 [Boletus coccyginus]